MTVLDAQLKLLACSIEALDDAGVEHALQSLIKSDFAVPAMLQLLELISPNASEEQKTLVLEDTASRRVTHEDLAAGRTPSTWRACGNAVKRSEAAAFYIARLARRSPESESTLAALMRDPNVEVRERVAFAAGRLRLHEVVFAALSDASPRVRQIAARAVGEASDSPLKSVLSLVQMLGDQNYEVCADAALALAHNGNAIGAGRDGVQAAIERVLAADRTPEGRRAVLALAELAQSTEVAGSLAVSALAELLQDCNASLGVKRAALELLWKIGPPAHDAADAIRSAVATNEALRELGADVLRRVAGD